jgi:nucleoside phosphorylase
MKIEKIGVIGAMHQEIALLLQDMEHVHKKTLGKAKCPLSGVKRT